MAAAAAAKVVHRCDAAKETGQLGKPLFYFRLGWWVIMIQNLNGISWNTEGKWLVCQIDTCTPVVSNFTNTIGHSI